MEGPRKEEKSLWGASSSQSPSSTLLLLPRVGDSDEAPHLHQPHLQHPGPYENRIEQILPAVKWGEMRTVEF